MTTTAEFLALVIPADALRDWTNYDGTGSSTNSTFLGYLATMAEGLFAKLTGFSADADTEMHQSALTACALYCLEMVKGRDHSLIRSQRDLAQQECKELRKLISVTPESTSPLTDDVPDETDAYPDMSIQNFNRKPSSIINERGKSVYYTDTSPSS